MMTSFREAVTHVQCLSDRETLRTFQSSPDTMIRQVACFRLDSPQEWEDLLIAIHRDAFQRMH